MSADLFNKMLEEFPLIKEKVLLARTNNNNYSRNWRKNNKERAKKSVANWKKNNEEHYNKYVRDYRRKNKEHHKKYMRDYRKRKKLEREARP